MMDKDLNDAVLAAFRRSAAGPEAEGDSAESPTEATEVQASAGAAVEAQPAVTVETDPSPPREAASGRGSAAKRPAGAKTPKAASGKAAPGGRQAKSGAARISRARPGALRAKAGGDEKTGGGGKVAILSLLLNLVLVGLVIVLLVRLSVLSSNLSAQQILLTEVAKVIEAADLVKMSKLVRVKGGSYFDPKSRPQTVMFVIDEDGGKLKIKQSVVRPLEGD